MSRDEGAASTVASFIVGIAIFVLAFSVVTIFVSVQVKSEAHHTEASIDLDSKASSALRAITTGPGVPADWWSRTSFPPFASLNPQHADPARLGFLKLGTETTLDVEKIRALNGDLNDVRWYEEKAKPLLGLENYEFHLRAYPIVRTDSNGNATGLRDYRVAYVGQHTGLHPAYVPDPATAGIDGPLLANTGVDYDDRLADFVGPSAGVFGEGDRFAQPTRSLTRLLALRLAGFPYAIDEVGGSANDSYWKVVDLTKFAPGASPYIPDAYRPTQVLTASNRVWSGPGGGSETWTYAKAAVPGTTTNDRLVLGPFDLTGHTGGKAWINLTHHVEGKSSGAPILQDHARIRYWCASGCTTTEWTLVPGAEWTTDGATVDEGWWVTRSVELPAETLGARIYLALSWESSFTDDQEEGWLIRDLSVEASAVDRGVRLYANALDYRTSMYDALVIGSGVDQNGFADPATGYTFRNALQAWVKAGGDLAALGTSSGKINNAWLAPTFTMAGTPGAAGPLYAEGSDLTHPAITAPHHLQYLAYPTPTTATYSVSSVFTNVLVTRTGAVEEPLLVVSNPNQDWRGTIVLTSYHVPGIPEAERHRFLTNTLAYMRYDVLYLDWGGTIPSGAAVGSASRTMLVDASAYRLGASDAFVVMYVWR